MNELVQKLLDKAVRQIYRKGFDIIYYDGKQGKCDFVNRLVWIPEMYKNTHYGAALIVHEAHHVKTNAQRLLLGTTAKSEKEVFLFMVNDEIQAYRKQFRFMAIAEDHPKDEIEYQVLERLQTYAPEWKGMLDSYHKIVAQRPSKKKAIREYKAFHHHYYRGLGLTPLGITFKQYLKNQEVSV